MKRGFNIKDIRRPLDVGCPQIEKYIRNMITTTPNPTNAPRVRVRKIIMGERAIATIERTYQNFSQPLCRALENRAVITAAIITKNE